MLGSPTTGNGGAAVYTGWCGKAREKTTHTGALLPRPQGRDELKLLEGGCAALSG